MEPATLAYAGLRCAPARYPSGALTAATPAARPQSSRLKLPTAEWAGGAAAVASSAWYAQHGGGRQHGEKPGQTQLAGPDRCLLLLTPAGNGKLARQTG